MEEIRTGVAVGLGQWDSQHLLQPAQRSGPVCMSVETGDLGAAGPFPALPRPAQALGPWLRREVTLPCGMQTSSFLLLSLQVAWLKFSCRICSEN